MTHEDYLAAYVAICSAQSRLRELVLLARLSPLTPSHASVCADAEALGPALDRAREVLGELEYRREEQSEIECPRCGCHVLEHDVIDGRCGECRLHEDEADWIDKAEGPLN